MESADLLAQRYRYTRADMCILRREDYRPPKLASECDEILKNYYSAAQRPFYGAPPFGRGARYRTKSGTQPDDAPTEESPAQPAPSAFRPSRPYFGAGPPRRGGWPPTGFREREYNDRADWRNVPDERDRDREREAPFEERERGFADRGYAERGRGRGGRYFAPADADRDWRAPPRTGYGEHRTAPYGERDKERDRGAPPSSLSRQRSTTATSTSDAVEQFVPSWEQKRIAGETDREPATGKTRSDSMSERGNDAGGKQDDDGWDEDVDTSWTRVDSRRTGRKRSESATEWDERSTKGSDRDRRELASQPQRVAPAPAPQPTPAPSRPTQNVPPTAVVPKSSGNENQSETDSKAKSTPAEQVAVSTKEPVIAIDVRAANANVLSPPSPTGALSMDIASAGIDAGDDDELADAEPDLPPRSVPTQSQFANLFSSIETGSIAKSSGNGFGLDVGVGMGIGRGRSLPNAAFTQLAAAYPSQQPPQLQPQPTGIPFGDPAYAQVLLNSVRQEASGADVQSPTLTNQPPVAVQWFYVDPQGIQQGPFESSQMDEWLGARYFYPTLPVRRDCDTQYAPLGDWLSRFGTGLFVDRSVTYAPPLGTPATAVPPREERAPRIGPGAVPYSSVAIATAAKPQLSDASAVAVPSEGLPFTSFSTAALTVQPGRSAGTLAAAESDAALTLGLARTSVAPSRPPNQQPTANLPDSAPLRGFGRGQLPPAATATVGNYEQLYSSADSQKNVPVHADPSFESIWDATSDSDAPTFEGTQPPAPPAQRDRTETSTSSSSASVRKDEPARPVDKKQQHATADTAKKVSTGTTGGAATKQSASTSAALPPGVVDEPEIDIPFEPASGKKGHQRSAKKANQKNKQAAAGRDEQRVPEKPTGPLIASYETPIAGLVRPSPSSSVVATASPLSRSEAKAAARQTPTPTPTSTNSNAQAWAAGSVPKWTAPLPTGGDSAPLSAIMEAQRAEELSTVRRELERQREATLNDMILESALQQSGTAWASRVKQTAGGAPEAIATALTGKKAKGTPNNSLNSSLPISGPTPAVVQPADFPALKPTHPSTSTDSHAGKVQAAKPNVASSQSQSIKAAPVQTQVATTKSSKQEKQKEKPVVAGMRLPKDIDVLNDFRAWCHSELTKLRVNFDIETFVEYVNTIEVDAEVDEYAIECIGESRRAEARAFVRSYVDRRKQIGLKQLLAKLHDHTTVQRAETVKVEQPPVADNEKHMNTEEGAESGGKKKKNKNQRVDRSLLGYRVQTSRVMVGEIDTGQV